VLLAACGLAACADRTAQRPGAPSETLRLVELQPRPAGPEMPVPTPGPDAVEEAGGPEESLAGNGVVSDFPLFAEDGTVVPI
jgi:hypothetical protein